MGKWFATVTITSSYQKLSSLLDAVPGFPGMRVLRNGKLRTAIDSTAAVRVSRVPPSETTGQDSLSNLFAAGEDSSFDQLDTTHVFVKTDSGTASLEVEAEDL